MSGRVDATECASRIRAAFPSAPVPSWPPGYGIDPLGVDEATAFADARWDEIAPVAYANAGYDVSPCIWFAQDATAGKPELWNFHLPGYMHASLLHDAEHDIAWWFLETMVDVMPQRRRAAGDQPWWRGAMPYERYSDEQVACVSDFLEYSRADLDRTGDSDLWTNRHRRFATAWQEFRDSTLVF